MHGAPAYKDLVLVGGGHSHSLLIRKWAMQPLPGVRLTLVSENPLTPYSGMLPGLLAGHYSYEQVHIDLVRLCKWAGVRFITARMLAIDLPAKRIRLDGRPDIEFDLLSLDTGSTPDLSVVGAREFATPVKPVSQLFDRWQQLNQNLENATQTDLGVVGSGAGGFEIVTALRHAMPETVTLHWILRGQRCLSGRPDKVGEYALQAVTESGIQVHKNFDVTSVSKDTLTAADGKKLPLDDVLWCTAAASPAWVVESGLQACNRGFVATNDYLQSVSHPFVFATGDIGTQVNTPSDKAGVFAVRQAPVLFENVRRYLLTKPLKPYNPQKTFLSLMAVGRKSAIASRGSLSGKGRIFWRLKDYIDQKFMRQFIELPSMPARRDVFSVPTAISGNATNDEPMRCKGCGGKVAESVLHAVLSQLHPVKRDDIASGLAQLGDAAVFSADKASWVQSVDQISAITDDPYWFGRMAAAHALSDVVTQTIDVHSAQAVVTLPYGGSDVTRRDLSQLLSGALDVFNHEDCALVGGHTAEAADMLLGFVVNGKLTEASRVGTTAALREGDAIVLCKALGTGVIMAAHGLLKASGADVTKALTQMQQSNRSAAQVLKAAQASRVTDVTGFGLLAHLHSLLGEDSLRASISTAALPLLNGAITLAESGVRSSLYESNSDTLRLFSGADKSSDAMKALLCDPQTSGGLLGIVPATNADAAISQLRSAGYLNATIVGRVVQAASCLIETDSSVY
ncbi:MAG: selenide, water dikinase SelD [Granulosicoccaceae bacterium]